MATLRLYPEDDPTQPCENCPALKHAPSSFRDLLHWPARAAVILLGHLGIALLLLAAIWLTGLVLKVLFGAEGHTLFGVVPLDWMFDAMDASIPLLFIGWGIVEANRELKGA
jgi:hypothetical protein